MRRVLGYMPDSFGVYDDMKVWEYLDFFARCYGIPADRRRRMIGDLLELVDLGSKRDIYVQGLSRGMQQRLCLAHTLVHDPLVLLLDEPASGLDPRARVELRELLRELRDAGQDDPRLVATSSPSSRSCAPRWRSSTAARCSPTGASPRSRSGCGSGPSCGSASWATPTRTRPPGPGSPASRTWSRPSCSTTARSRSASTATTTGPPGCWPTPSAAGLRVASFARAASDLEELFLQVTAPDPVPAEASGMSAPRRGHRSAAAGASARSGTSGPGMAAVGVKELRGRMRGRRAFVILTLYLLLVAGFAWMIESLAERTYSERLRRLGVLRVGGDRAADVHRRSSSCSRS